MIHEPLISTGTIIVLRPEAPAGDGAACNDIGKEVSTGKALKKFSSFFAAALSFCLSRPMVPVFVFTKYHLIPSGSTVAAKGEISSTLVRVPTTVEEIVWSY